MKLKALLKNENAVSPVIGVILMVAITVILAAVIASFVLGLGDTADEVQPNSTLSFDYDGSSTVTITLTDGDALSTDEVFLRGDAISCDTTTGAVDDDDIETCLSGSNDDSPSGEWVVGDSATVEDSLDTSGETIRVVWEELGGDNAATLETQDFDF